MANKIGFMDFITLVEKYDALQPVIDQVSKMMNINIRMYPSDYPKQSGPSKKQNDAFSNDNRNIHFMRVCSPTYLRCKSDLIPLVSPSIIDHSHFKLPLDKSINIVNEPLYYSVFITNDKTQINNTQDIIKRQKNKLILAVNDIHSLSGYHNIKLWLSNNKLLNNKNCPFFKIITSGGHLNSIKLIQNGIADIAVIDIYVLLSHLKQNNNKYNGFKILSDGILGPYHAPVITVSKRFVKNYGYNVKELQQIFLKSLNENKEIAQKLKEQMLIGGFVECDMVRLKELTRLLKTAGTDLMQLPHQTISKL